MKKQKPEPRTDDVWAHRGNSGCWVKIGVRDGDGFRVTASLYYTRQPSRLGVSTLLKSYTLIERDGVPVAQEQA